jgi:hypothetical protein
MKITNPRQYPIWLYNDGTGKVWITVRSEDGTHVNCAVIPQGKLRKLCSAPGYTLLDIAHITTGPHVTVGKDWYTHETS